MILYHVISLFLEHFLNSQPVHLHSLVMGMYGWLVVCVSRHVTLGPCARVFSRYLWCGVLHRLCRDFTPFWQPLLPRAQGCHR